MNESTTLPTSEEGGVDKAFESLNSSTNLIKVLNQISGKVAFARHILLGILAWHYSDGFAMSILLFIGFTMAFFIIGIVICQTSRLFFLGRHPIQREAYLMNCAATLPILMTIALLVYTIAVFA